MKERINFHSLWCRDLRGMDG